MQDVCRTGRPIEPKSLYSYRRRKSHRRYVGSYGNHESYRERYEIQCVHEVWHFPEHTDALFKEYVNTFLKIKQEASGYPEWCVTEEQKQAYIDDYYEHEGIRLDPTKIRKNPGMRSIAKLMLNSLWGNY